MNKRSAFTLIELLIVIAIIAILAAILFPVFAAAREKARQSACTSNLKQFSIAILQYAQDNDDVFPVCAYENPGPGPIHLDWMHGLYSYIKTTGIFQCPSATLHHSINGDGVLDLDYGINFNIVDYHGDYSACPAAQMSLLQQPARTVLMFEVVDQAGGSAGFSPSTASLNDYGVQANGSAGNYLYFASFDTGYMGGYSNSAWLVGSGCNTEGTVQCYQNPTGRHNGGSNFLLADGHVKWLQGSTISIGNSAAHSGCAQAAGGSCSTNNAASTDTPTWSATFSPI